MYTSDDFLRDCLAKPPGQQPVAATQTQQGVVYVPTPAATRQNGGGWTVALVGLLVGIIALLAINGGLIGVERQPTTASAPTGTVVATRTVEPTRAVVTRVPVPGNIIAGVPTAAPPAVPTATPTTVQSTVTPTEAPCYLATWPDGSQSCDDGRHIDAKHSQPGYCKIVTWDDGTVSCNNGESAGLIIRPLNPTIDPPTATPDAPAPTSNVTWVSLDGPDGNTCVRVAWPNGRTQTSCSDPGHKMQGTDAAYVARMIEDGKIAPGKRPPKG